MLDWSMKLMNEEKNDLMIEFMELQSLINKEKNYFEILIGYCESALDKSDDYNKIYPLLETIYDLQLKVYSHAEKLFLRF